ncbi:MAG: S8 family serine peptidase [Candidatus Limnocylindria bacterium]
MSRRVTMAAALIAALVLATPVAAVAPVRSNADSTRTSTTDRAYALVQLKLAPLATASASKPAPGKKIDFNRSETKNYRSQLSAQRNEFKAWLRTNLPNARVTGEYDIALNGFGVKLSGHTLAQLMTSPLVVRAEYQNLYYPLTDSDPDLALIDALQAWNRAGGAANAGRGVKVAIVDSGIDQTHPCFSDAGYPAQPQIGVRQFTNNKVIAAKVFNNKAGSRAYTPEAIDSHGTHVAGTVACNYHTPATVDGVDIPYDMSGVAPAALLGNYNVFPSDVGNARSEDIMNALHAAYADGFDVANMSLGGGSSGKQDLLSMAVDNLDRANMVVAVSAGNNGPGHFTVGSPGIAPRALTAGASTVPHFVGAPVTVAGAGTFGAASGDFAVVTANLTRPLGVVAGTTNGLSTACTALPAASLTGKIALVSRGTCAFTVKVRNAQNAGAAAVLVANNVAGDPTAMGSDGTPNQPTIPAYMVGLETGKLFATKNGASTTIVAALSYFSTPNDDIMAGFSSQGPTDVDFRVKPDVVAPGVNVLSSVPAAYCAAPPCFAFFQGTSMAAPHLAGSAAVVRGQHPTWSAAQVRSAIVNTAERGVLTAYTDGTTVVTDVQIQGAGRENLNSATGARVAIDPVSVSFGAIPAGAGQTKTFKVTLRALGAGGTYPLAIANTTGTGITYSVSPANVTLATNGSATATVTMTAAKAASRGDHQAWLNVGTGGAVAHAAVYTLVK